MDLADLETALRAARRDVFNDDPVIADAAAARITALRAAIERHPEEVARRATAKQNADARLWFRWL